MILAEYFFLNRTLNHPPGWLRVCIQGDLVEIVIMTKDGIRRDELMLKLD